jgi:16S rRNA (uracil1498-N3)-methyltransferase
LSAPRFFVEGVRAPGDIVAFGGADARKIATVLRLREGDAVAVIDSTATLFAATLDRSLHAVLGARVAGGESERGLRVTVAQGIPKGQKMDFVVEKLTELGVTALLPFESERSVVIGAGGNKVERWRRLAKTAAAQCGRREIPAVESPLTFADVIARFDGYDCVLFPWELAPRALLRDALPAAVANARDVLVVIGPEGGFSHAEAEAATAAGARVLSLGSRILRTETAGIALLAILNYATEGDA